MPSFAQAEASGKPVHRLSITVAPEQYDHLVEIAQKNRVSIAWVVREAIERLLSDEMPLFYIRNQSS